MKNILSVSSIVILGLASDYSFGQLGPIIDFPGGIEMTTPAIKTDLITRNDGALNPFVVSGRHFNTNLGPNPATLADQWLAKYDFADQNCIPNNDANFWTNFFNNLPPNVRTGSNEVFDIESYGRHGLFAILTQGSGTTAPNNFLQNNCLKLVDQNGNITTPFRTGNNPENELYFTPGKPIDLTNTNAEVFDLACTGSGIIYVGYHRAINSSPETRQVYVVAYSVGAANALNYLYHVSVPNPSWGTYNTNPIIELLPDGNLVLGTTVRTADAGNTLVGGLISVIYTNAGTTLSPPNLNEQIWTNDQILSVEGNEITNEIYVGGIFSDNGNLISRFLYSTFGQLLNNDANFISNLDDSEPGSYVTSIDFLPNCDIVLGGVNLRPLDLTSGYTSVATLDQFGAFSNNTNDIPAQVNDIVVFESTAGCVNLFAANNANFNDNPPTFPNDQHNFFSELNLGSVFAGFDYCKTHNADGTFNIQLSNVHPMANLTFTLDGNPISNLANLTGTLVVTSTISSPCSNVIVCYQETILSGGMCVTSGPTNLSNSVGSNSSNSCHKMETVKSKSVAIYPNPSSSSFIIKGEFNTNDKVVLTVSDINGTKIHEKTIEKFDNNGEELDLKNASAGTYLVTLAQGKTQITSTIIKQ